MNTILPSYPTYQFNSYYITIVHLIEKRSSAMFFEDCYLSNLLQSDDGDFVKRKKIPL
ncbi:hypothetical protein CCP3SC1AL1_3710003 [Gammaproteobacteria bacterium]